MRAAFSDSEAGILARIGVVRRPTGADEMGHLGDGAIDIR